ncbi:MAG: hypothetical protein MJ237_01840 [bacterium]|nr:hypothetical protein [bacterium]
MHKKKQVTFKSNVHIIDGFLHADNMEHFSKAALTKARKVSDVQMHYVDCNIIDINSKQLRDIEETLKSLSPSLRSGDYLVIPGLASVPILNLEDRIKNVLGKKISLTANNLRSYKDVLLEFLKEIYNYKNYYSSEIRYLDKNGQNIEYTYGIIQEINNLKNRDVNIYLPAGHGADETIKWIAKRDGMSDKLYKYIATGKDTNGEISELFKYAKRNNYYNFNLLSLSNAHIVNIQGRNGSDYIFSAKDGFINDSARGVYNFSPVRNYDGKILGYSYHDENTVEYPFADFKANEQIANLCKYVGLPKWKVVASYSENNDYKRYLRNGYSTSSLPDKLYSIGDVYDTSEIQRRGLDNLGSLISKDGLIFDTNNSDKIIFQKTNCEGSDKPSVMQMWGSCFSSINAMVRDLGKNEIDYSSSNTSNATSYITKGYQEYLRKNYASAEHYYNEALNIMHPNRTSLNFKDGTIELYDKLYSVLKARGKHAEAKGVANMLINLNSYDIKNLSVYDSKYLRIQSKVGDYYKDLADFCERDCEYYPAKVCRWAVDELKKSTSCGDKIIQRRAEQNQYIGDLYDACR